MLFDRITYLERNDATRHFRIMSSEGEKPTAKLHGSKESRESELRSVSYNRPVWRKIVREKREITAKINIALEPYKITWWYFIG